MALESLKARQERAARDAEHERRSAAAIAQEQKVLGAAAERAARTPAEKQAETAQTSRDLVAAHEAKQERAVREDKMLRERLANKSARDSEDTDPLAGVEFASSAARDAADDAELTAEDFKRRRKASERGFTKADVERIAVAAGAEE